MFKFSAIFLLNTFKEKFPIDIRGFSKLSFNQTLFIKELDEY